jgi:Tfp pilus assembly protein PilX
MTSGTSADRLAGERGSGLVAGLTLMFAFTFLGIVWLARDVDRSVSNRSTASSIAFQSARSGAQAAFAPGLREGLEPVIDVAAAHTAAITTANRLFSSYGVVGTVSVVVEIDQVRTEVTVTDAGRTVSGSATVRSQRAP